MIRWDATLCLQPALGPDSMRADEAGAHPRVPSPCTGSPTPAAGLRGPERRRRRRRSHPSCRVHRGSRDGSHDLRHWALTHVGTAACQTPAALPCSDVYLRLKAAQKGVQGVCTGTSAMQSGDEATSWLSSHPCSHWRGDHPIHFLRTTGPAVNRSGQGHMRTPAAHRRALTDPQLV